MIQIDHSVLHPAGPQALGVVREYRFFLVVATAVFLLTIGAAIWAMMRRRRVDEDPRSPVREQRAHRVIYGAVGATVTILFVTLVYDLALGRSLTRRDTNTMLSIRITGRQWWWEVEYEDPVPQNRVHSANELHIPVGRPVALKLESTDVIHSFWAPNLMGKKDLIPGQHRNEIFFQADTPGIYRVQCAEFCGLQHAKMAMYVVAQSAADFAQWLANERQLATPTIDTLTERGKLVFESGACAMCHTIAGTSAHGTLGPELTHVASRHSLAAGAIPNTRGHLAGWVVDPQRIKPGVLMPSNALDPADLQALLAYLGSLR